MISVRFDDIGFIHVAVNAMANLSFKTGKRLDLADRWKLAVDGIANAGMALMGEV